MKIKVKFIVIATIMLSLIGCTSQEKETALSENQVTLRWVLMGNKQADSDEVWSVFNEKLHSKLPNTKVEIEMIPSASYAEKWRLFSAANENIDMAWHGWVLDLRDEVNKGAYMQIDALIDEFAPNLKASIPKWIWDEQRIDGKLYSFPNYQMMVSRINGYRTLDEYASEFLDKERITAAFLENEKLLQSQEGKQGKFSCYSAEVWDAIDDYLSKLKEADKLGLGYSPEIPNWLSLVGGVKTVAQVAYIVQDDSGRYIAKDLYGKDSPYKELYRKMHDFYKKGYIRKDVLTYTSNTNDFGTKGGYALWLHKADDFTAKQETLKYGTPIHVIKTGSKVAPMGRPSDTNSVIPTTAKEPARAMQLYELINSETDTELYNILVHGIENTHYIKKDSHNIETLENAQYSMQGWIVGNTFNAYETQKSLPGYNDYIKNVLHNPDNIEVTDENLLGFSFDTQSVKGNIAQIESVLAEYKGLKYGVFDDWQLRCEQMELKLEKSGKAEVIKEIQRQLDTKINK